MSDPEIHPKLIYFDYNFRQKVTMCNCDDFPDPMANALVKKILKFY